MDVVHIMYNGGELTNTRGFIDTVLNKYLAKGLSTPLIKIIVIWFINGESNVG